MSLSTSNMLQQPHTNAQPNRHDWLIGSLLDGRLLLGLTLLVGSSLVGCQSKEGITTYYTENSISADQATASDESNRGPKGNLATAGLQNRSPVKQAPRQKRGKPTDRMIAAIVPTDNQAWFLKVVGPKKQVDSAKTEIDAFFAQLKIESGKPVWKLPEGWKTGPEKMMRLATLLIPTSDEPNPDEPNPDESDPDESKPIELSVIGLPITGEWSGQVLSNVNRWRGQLSRDPLTQPLLEEMTTPLEIAEGAILFDSTGWFSDGGMSANSGAPFAPFANGNLTSKDQPKQSAPAPGGSMASMANGPAVPVGRGELKETAPEGWTDLPGSSMRKASYSTPDGATVTAFVFPATAPAMADPLANVNRWRGEVGLGPTTNEALEETSEQLTLAGGKATYVELVGKTETTLAAMTPRGDQVWFFKLRGPKAAAEAQRDAFQQWLASIEL